MTTKINTTNPYWMNRIKREGVHLMVEMTLTFEQFRTLLDHFIGAPHDDEEVLHFWSIANRRLLPEDCGSFSGIGHDIGSIVKERLDELTEVEE